MPDPASEKKKPRSRPAVMGADFMANLAAEVHEEADHPERKKTALDQLKAQMPTAPTRRKTQVPDFLAEIAAEVKDGPEDGAGTAGPKVSKLFQQLASEVKDGSAQLTEEKELPELYQQLATEVKKEALDQLARAEEMATMPPAPLLDADEADAVLVQVRELFSTAEGKKAALQRGIPKARGDEKVSLLKRFNKSLRLFRHLDSRASVKEIELAFVFVRKLLDRVNDGLYPEMVRGLDSLTDDAGDPLPFPQNQMLESTGVVVWNTVRTAHILGARNYLEIAISVLEGHPPSVRLDTLGFSDDQLDQMFSRVALLPHSHWEDFTELKTIGDPVFAQDVNRLRDNYLERPENRYVTVVRLLQANVQAAADKKRDEEARALALKILKKDVEMFRERGSLDDIVSCLPSVDQERLESLL